MADNPTGLPKPKLYLFLPTRIAGPVPPSSESRQPMATSSCDRRGSSTLLKKVKATTLAMSTRLEVAAMDNLIGCFIVEFRCELSAENGGSKMEDRTFRSSILHHQSSN